jgi:hypothetical protein
MHELRLLEEHDGVSEIGVAPIIVPSFGIQLNQQVVLCNGKKTCASSEHSVQISSSIEIYPRRLRNESG